MRHLQATNQAALEALLSSNGVDTSIWGRNTSKSVGDLWQETDAGESRLVANGAFGQLERHVEIVSVTLTRYVYPSIFLCYLHHHVPPHSDSLTHQNTPLSTPPPPPHIGHPPLFCRETDGRVLYEASQTLPDGRVRSRGAGCLISEKLLSRDGESWRDGALRALHEELDTRADQVVVEEDSHTLTEERREAVAALSYPGLICVYKVHRVKMRLRSGPWVNPDLLRFSTREPRGEGQWLRTDWVWRTPDEQARAERESVGETAQ